MEIKTEEEIIKSCGFIDVVRIDNPYKRWVAVDDIREFIKENMFDIKDNVIQLFEKHIQDTQSQELKND